MKIIAVRRAVIGLLILCLAFAGSSTAQSNQDLEHRIGQTDSAASGVHDFDFVVGHWRSSSSKAEGAARQQPRVD